MLPNKIKTENFNNVKSYVNFEVVYSNDDSLYSISYTIFRNSMVEKRKNILLFIIHTNHYSYYATNYDFIITSFCTLRIKVLNNFKMFSIVLLQMITLISNSVKDVAFNDYIIATYISTPNIN